MIARPEMIIRRHGNGMRFYSQDGWTRDLVKDMLESKNIRKVIPRYYDFNDDRFFNNSLQTESTQGGNNADFFGVYDFNENFIESRIEKHRIIDAPIKEPKFFS